MFEKIQWELVKIFPGHHLLFWQAHVCNQRGRLTRCHFKPFIRQFQNLSILTYRAKNNWRHLPWVTSSILSRMISWIWFMVAFKPYLSSSWFWPGITGSIGKLFVGLFGAIAPEITVRGHEGSTVVESTQMFVFKSFESKLTRHVGNIWIEINKSQMTKINCPTCRNIL